MKRPATAAPKAKRSRTRSGCFTCRDRHMKCDEQLPVCQNCINSKRRCYRGIRLNFSSYNYYDPKSSGFWGDALVPYYRIIDQSIAVAKLYKNGYLRYRPYRHLHAAKELEEAAEMLRGELQLNQHSTHSLEMAPEPELLLQPDDLSQFFDSWLYSGPNTDNTLVPNRIQENVDIKRILMNPELHDKQLGGVMHADFHQKLAFPPDEYPPRSYAAATAPELHMGPANADDFIRLVHQQKYFWLLDLFNELRIWESYVPSYCVRLHQASALGGHDEKFLFDCLMLSGHQRTDHAPRPERTVEMCQAQAKRWREFERKDVTFATYPAFEKILISVVLIVSSVLDRACRAQFTLDGPTAMVLANQGKLVHKLWARYRRIPGTILKRLASPVFTVAALQAIAILRFFMKMRFARLGLAVSAAEPSSVHADADISYSPAKPHNVAIFFAVPEPEMTHLCTRFHDLDLASAKPGSDAGKLRVLFWDLVLYEYQGSHGSRSPVSGPASADPPQSQLAIVPNSRCLALNILRCYRAKIRGGPAASENASDALADIFREIGSSALPPDIKAKWVQYFDWSLAA